MCGEAEVDDGSFWIECSGCFQWYHGYCVDGAGSIPLVILTIMVYTYFGNINQKRWNNYEPRIHSKFLVHTKNSGLLHDQFWYMPKPWFTQ